LKPSTLLGKPPYVAKHDFYIVLTKMTKNWYVVTQPKSCLPFVRYKLALPFLVP
jgi:hypothetical protein